MARPCPILPLLATATVLAWAPLEAGAQLRPLDPLDWRDLGGEGESFALGVGMHWGQRASLAGSEGLLVELGRFKAAWSVDRLSLELAGTARWLFEERTSYASPSLDVLPAVDDRRQDWGDLRVSTVVRLTPAGRAGGFALRFGARLPTTDNLQGLDRDQTDLYATSAGWWEPGRLALGGELGVGIFGTRNLRQEQVDVLLFGFTARYDMGPADAILELTGQHDTRAGAEMRGNEDLGEARLGLQLGRARWIRAALVRGWTPASPDVGITVELGRRF